MIDIDSWTGCYPSNWKGVIVEEAILIRRIYDHMVGEGWLRGGDSVLDPFGGVALGAYDAMRIGLHWSGVELEERFARIGHENIRAWNARFGGMPKWGSAKLLQGDSRQLLKVIAGAQAAISSPPYADSINSGKSGVDWTKTADKRYRPAEAAYARNPNTGAEMRYGETPGQLGAMRAEGFKAAISSPPFLQSEGGTPEPKPGGVIDARLQARHAAGNASAHGYGTSAGQLSSMRGDGFSAAVSSPPYDDTPTKTGVTKGWKGSRRVGASQNASEGYGETEGQLGGAEDFWLAAREIVAQVYLALTPGGHAVWVVKDYVKSRQVVHFCDQWRQLCEAVGFETLHEHHAMLVHGKQITLEGGIHIKESKSFFRRMAEKKGSPRIDYEVVYCMEKQK